MRYVSLMCVLAVALIMGCGPKNIIDPMNVGFSQGEYVAIAGVNNSTLGTLYYAFTNSSDMTTSVGDCQWTRSRHNLFPPLQKYNNIISEHMESMTRKLNEQSKGSASLKASPFLDFSGSGNFYFKYESTTRKYFELMPDQYNPEARAFMELLVRNAEAERKAGRNVYVQFAYVNSIYEGASFLEIFREIDSQASVAAAVVNIGGTAYASTNQTFIKDGNVMFRLVRLFGGELDAGTTVSDTKSLGSSFGNKSKPLDRVFQLYTPIEDLSDWKRAPK